MEDSYTVQQLRRHRLFRTAFVVGSVTIYIAILLGVLSVTKKGHEIAATDAISLISVGGFLIWSCVGIWIEMNFANAVPKDGKAKSNGM